jgi:hypothetical protein
MALGLYWLVLVSISAETLAEVLREFSWSLHINTYITTISCIKSLSTHQPSFTQLFRASVLKVQKGVSGPVAVAWRITFLFLT